MSPKEFSKRPRLVLVLVVDQFRSDQLMNGTFLPAGTKTNPGGFQFLTDSGAWFPFAEYSLLQSMTCPGHATVLTGAIPSRHGITQNDWFDRATKKTTYCAEDAEFGSSPRKLKTTTVGDELKIQNPKSKVFAISLKDRSAIMLGGKNPDGVYWISSKEMKWTTSAYYNNGELPDWINKLNSSYETNQKSNGTTTAKSKPDDKNVDSVKFAHQELNKLALEIIQKEKLGQDEHTDILAISFSGHDAIGHAFGPNSKELAEILLHEDKMLSELFKGISSKLKGMDNVSIVLTSDHGIPPTPDYAKNQKHPSGHLDFLALFKTINKEFDDKFGSSGNKEWISGYYQMHFYFNQELLREKKVNQADAEKLLKSILQKQPGVHTAFSHDDFLRNHFPSGVLGLHVRNSYLPAQSGDVLAIPEPFFFQKTSVATTHVTSWSYDRYVPLVFWGKHFKPGVHTGGFIIDIAPTLSFTLGIIPPSMSEGQVIGVK